MVFLINLDEFWELFLIVVRIGSQGEPFNIENFSHQRRSRRDLIILDEIAVIHCCSFAWQNVHKMSR